MESQLWSILQVDFGKSLVLPCTLSPLNLGGFLKCNSLKVKPSAGDLSFA